MTDFHIIISFKPATCQNLCKRRKLYTLWYWKIDIRPAMFYAHTTPNPDKSDWQFLRVHLNNVAKISSEFADVFKASEFAYAGGLLHDLGKYSPEFQKRLEGVNIPVDHATAGAREAIKKYHASYSRMLAYVITGHHGGLLNYGSPESGLEERMAKSVLP